jgi:hypothetical protein
MPTADRERRTERIQVPVTPSERAAIEAQALGLGVSRAELLRTGWKYWPRPKVTR